MIEVKMVGAAKSDLISNFRLDRNHKMISTESASTRRVLENPSPAVKIPVVDERRPLNGTTSYSVGFRETRFSNSEFLSDVRIYLFSGFIALAVTKRVTV